MIPTNMNSSRKGTGFIYPDVAYLPLIDGKNDIYLRLLIGLLTWFILGITKTKPQSTLNCFCSVVSKSLILSG